MMLQKDKDRLGYAEGMSEEEAKKLQMDIYMQMYKSGDVDKEILQTATNIADRATTRSMFGIGPTMSQKELNKQIDNAVKNINSEPNPDKINPDFLVFLVNQEMERLTKNDREQKAEGGSLKNPEKADLDKDGKISDYEQARGEAIEESIEEEREGMQEGGPMGEQMEMLMGEDKEEPEMQSDEEMEKDYLDFVINEALTEEEEDLLMEQLERNPQLSEIFDKVMEVASEFSGAGPVEGPGTEVSDSIPARLSDGEFVFTAKAVEEIGADKLMSMMKEAEAAADERLPAQEGGVVEEDEAVAPREPVQVQQDIRVTKETVGSQAAMQEEEDLVGDEIKNHRHIRCIINCKSINCFIKIK